MSPSPRTCLAKSIISSSDMFAAGSADGVLAGGAGVGAGSFAVEATGAGAWGAGATVGAGGVVGCAAGLSAGGVPVGGAKEPIAGGEKLGTAGAGAATGVRAGTICPMAGGLKLMVGRTGASGVSEAFTAGEEPGLAVISGRREASQTTLVTKTTCTLASRQRTPRAVALARPRSALRMEGA